MNVLHGFGRSGIMVVLDLDGIDCIWSIGIVDLVAFSKVKSLNPSDALGAS